MLLFSQTSQRIELHERGARGFRTEVIVGEQPLKLPCLGIELAISTIYANAGL